MLLQSELGGVFLRFNKWLKDNAVRLKAENCGAERQCNVSLPLAWNFPRFTVLLLTDHQFPDVSLVPLKVCNRAIADRRATKFHPCSPPPIFAC